MNWRWVSMTSLLAAAVVSYGVLVRQNGADDIATERSRAQPGYYLKDAIVTDTTDDGTPGLRLAARRIEQHPENGSITLRDVTVDYLALPERSWRLTANEGIVPGGTTTIRFSGDVALAAEGEPRGAVIRTDALSIDTQTSIATTDEPVSIELGGHHVLARGMMANLKDNHVQLESEVNGRFVPE
jgi:LPS export ABC transporter protein LptC